MEFGLLGPLEVRGGDGPLRLPARKQRALLALLLLHANRVVARERLIDLLWGEAPPESAVKALQVYVSQLRKLLPAGILVTRAPGYLLEVEPKAVDLLRFERLVAEARAADPARASSLLAEALGLWRGPPLAEFREEPFARVEARRLEDLRLAALEERIEADLALGRHAELVGELEALVGEDPHRERLRGQLMLALYRSGRQADALAAYQDARAVLLEELGLDPGDELQRLEKAILVHDPSLELLAAVATGGTGARVRPNRKLVTVLRAAVVSSTELGEGVDPEALSALRAAFLDRMRSAAERHGGVVEDIGEAATAVFGVPAVHEDDALRALRAAVETREAMNELGIEGRIGVESGEVVVGGAEQRVIGRVVTVAARLEQSAEPGEIRLGEQTLGLARDAVTAEPVKPLVVERKNEPVPVWRLVSVSAEPPMRANDSPFVGRQRELSTLSDAWERVGSEQSCELVTVIGTAGVGKSRLVAELLRRVDATVAVGRCLSYGAGITYWPVVDLLAQLQPSLPDLDPAVATTLRALLDDEGEASTGELAWAFRKFVEAVARERPLLLVFDDIQWAEEALLELTEHLALVSVGVPILLVCMARPELLERRPGWKGVLRLEALSARESAQLVQARLGGREPAVSERIVAAAGGNPLFLEAEQCAQVVLAPGSFRSAQQAFCRHAARVHLWLRHRDDRRHCRGLSHGYAPMVRRSHGPVDRHTLFDPDHHRRAFDYHLVRHRHGFQSDRGLQDHRRGDYSEYRRRD